MLAFMYLRRFSVFCPYLLECYKIVQTYLPYALELIQSIKVSLNFYVFLYIFLKQDLFFFCHITAPTVHTDDEEFQRISTLFREKHQEVTKSNTQQVRPSFN